MDSFIDKAINKLESMEDKAIRNQNNTQRDVLSNNPYEKPKKYCF